MNGRLARLIAGAGLALVGATVAAATAWTPPAAAADLSDFEAGHIISDANFYDSDAMTASQVQSFLNQKVETCREDLSAGPNDPIVCLKDYRQTTTAKPADAFCDGYEAKSQTAAQIINGVARSCGISQKVLLVLLQKETGLVTHTYPSEWRYDRATGYACPDTAPCDTQYYGFFNQLYSAARQYQIYRAYPTSYGYVAGQTNLIKYHPNSACGRTSVYIHNQATAGLYIYTPYVPNQAALDAGYGTGNSCSSYGNRNFFSFYSDWFGSPTAVINAKLKPYWNSLGGADGPGYALSDAVKVGGGVYQEFENLVLFSSPQGVTVHLSSSGSITSAYLASGGPKGSWGWPTGTSTRANGVWRVPFTQVTAYQRGGDVRTATVPMHASLERVWFDFDRGLGAVSAAVVSDGGVYQELGGGYLFLSADGAATFYPGGWGITAAYFASGGPDGAWGWPVTSGERVDDVYTYAFANADVYSLDGSPRAVVGEMRQVWAEHGGAAGAGYPVADTVIGDDGVYQEFAKHTLFRAPDGTQTRLATAGAITRAYLAAGGALGEWGWPAGPSTAVDGIWRVTLTGLTAYNVGGEVRTSLYPLHASLESVWIERGMAAGAVAPATEQDGGVHQQFELGELYLTDEGIDTLLPDGWRVTAAYLAAGGPSGSWGWPLGDGEVTDGGFAYGFEHARAFGRNGQLLVVSGPMLDAWTAAGALDGPGYPIAAPVAVGEGVYQEFERRYLLIDPVGTVQELGTTGAITAAYIEAGGPEGAWGWPTAPTTKTNGVWHVPFTNLTAYNRNGNVRTSTIPVHPELARAWYAYPGTGGAVTAAVEPAGGIYQEMDGGYLFRTDDGQRTLLPEGWRITRGYLEQGGPSGEWGWPLGDGVKSDGVYVYTCENVIVYGEKTGLRVVGR